MIILLFIEVVLSFLQSGHAQSSLLNMYDMRERINRDNDIDGKDIIVLGCYGWTLNGIHLHHHPRVGYLEAVYMTK